MGVKKGTGDKKSSFDLGAIANPFDTIGIDSTQITPQKRMAEGLKPFITSSLHLLGEIRMAGQIQDSVDQQDLVATRRLG